MRKKKAVRGRNIIIANGEKKMSLNKKEWYRLSRKIKWGEQIKQKMKLGKWRKWKEKIWSSS